MIALVSREHQEPLALGGGQCCETIRATPGLASPLRTDKTSMSDQTIPLPLGVASGVVTVQRPMIMSGDFLEMSSQLVKGLMNTADAPAAASSTTNVTDVFMLI